MDTAQLTTLIVTVAVPVILSAASQVYNALSVNRLTAKLDELRADMRTSLDRLDQRQELVVMRVEKLTDRVTSLEVQLVGVR